MCSRSGEVRRRVTTAWSSFSSGRSLLWRCSHSDLRFSDGGPSIDRFARVRSRVSSGPWRQSSNCSAKSPSLPGVINVQGRPNLHTHGTLRTGTKGRSRRAPRVHAAPVQVHGLAWHQVTVPPNPLLCIERIMHEWFGNLVQRYDNMSSNDLRVLRVVAVT